MTVREIRDRVAERLASAVDASEAQAMANAILEDERGYTALDLALYGSREITPESEQHLMRIAERVVAGEPLQYVLGVAHFHGRKFKVDSSTLIPRPETSELIDIIVKECGGRTDLRVLDIGTGSGCIAISLALDLKFPTVYAIDNSPRALEMAKANAAMLKAKVEFIEANALHLSESPLAKMQWDVIVSNPPYVLNSEKASMEARVLDYEPGTALFVPDATPILFYEAIADYAASHMNKGGKLFFEINPLCSAQVLAMLRSKGFANAEIQMDYKQNKRFATA